MVPFVGSSLLLSACGTTRPYVPIDDFSNPTYGQSENLLRSQAVSDGVCYKVKGKVVQKADFLKILDRGKLKTLTLITDSAVIARQGLDASKCRELVLLEK